MMQPRGLAAIAAVATLWALLPLSAASANHTSDTVNIVLPGADNSNVAVALRFAQLTFPTGADDVVLARDDVFPDALASGVLQGAVDGPLLLTDGDSLDAAVLAELERLEATTVNILGGAAAVSEEVEQELRSEGYDVARFSGPTRVETAIAIASALPTAQRAIVARAYAPPGGDPTQAFADSLAAGGFAADGALPVLLTQTEQLSATTRDYLAAPTTLISEVVIVGGTAAVSARTASEIEALGVTVRRIAGSNRFATAVAVAQERGFASSADADRTILAEGQASDAWAGGFAAAAHADLFDAPIVLSNGADLPNETTGFLVPVPAGAGTQSDHQADPALVCAAPVGACDSARAELGFGPAGTLRLDATEVGQGEELTGTFDGADVEAASVEGCGLSRQPLDLAADGSFALTIPGGAAVGDCSLEFDFTFPDFTQEEQVTITIVEGDGVAQDIPVVPRDATVRFVSGADPDEDRGARTYTASADPGTLLRISLFPAANVTVSATGGVVFADSDNDGQADGADTGAGHIEQLGGVAQPGTPSAAEVAVPASASITFRVDSTVAGETVPVVYVDANSNDQVELDTADRPTEDIGTGGAMTWVPEEAPAGQRLLSQNITDVNEDPGNALGAPYFVTAAGTYLVDANDTVQIRQGSPAACTQVQRADFLRELSRGDDLFAASTYSQDRTATSVLCIDDTAPAAPAAPTFSDVTASSVRVTSAAVSHADQYVFLRASSAAGPFTEVGRSPSAALTDAGLSANTSYFYRTAVVSDGDTSPPSPVGETRTLAGDAGVRPRINDSRKIADGPGLAGSASPLDQWLLTFNKSMDATTASAGVFRLRDGDGTIIEVDCGAATNANCALSVNATVLTITLASPTTVQPGDTSGAQYPLTVIDASTGVRDSAGLVVDLAASNDLVVDDE